MLLPGGTTRENIITPKVENGPFSVVIGTYLTVAKAEKHSHAETLGKEKLHFTSVYISSSQRTVSEENSRLGNLLQFLAHERGTEVPSSRLTFKYLLPMNYEIVVYFFILKLANLY